MEMTFAQHRFEARRPELGLNPFPAPSANMSRAYTNPLGVQLAPCTYCGFCEKFGCGNYLEGQPADHDLPVLMKKPNFTLRTHCEVLHVVQDRDGAARHRRHLHRRARRALRAAGRDRDPLRLPALQHAADDALGHRRDLQSATGEGLVGKNYTYQVMSGVDIFFEEEFTNQFVGAGALGMVVDDYNGDNFDHSGLGFIGGAYIACWTTNARPIERHPRARRHARMGREVEAAVQRQLPEAHLALGPRRVDGATRATISTSTRPIATAYGRPLMRMTYDFTENDRG
jgi:gluconate 2-dehydrogenase alpha chain